MARNTYKKMAGNAFRNSNWNASPVSYFTFYINLLILSVDLFLMINLFLLIN
jgi:hypothetical protein